MKKVKTKQKAHKTRVDFAQRLEKKLIESGLGQVESGELRDSIGRWVNIKIGDSELCFSFDMKGEIIDGVGLYKDVVEVVSQTKIWSATK